MRNAAKTVATWTADYGVACSNARITFDWENADGTKFGTVTRRANSARASESDTGPEGNLGAGVVLAND